MKRGDTVGEAIHSENAEKRRKNFILAVIITIIVIYAAVPTYGIIRDIGAGEHVFVLSSNLPGVQMNRPVLGFIDRLHSFFHPKQEVLVPVEQRIDLKGRVVYTDKTPYPDGLIELRSEPRYTRTDKDGYFMFIDVGEGDHNINVLDDAGNVLASCAVVIDRTSDLEDAEIIRLSDGTYVFQVAVHVKVLEITIYLHRGGDGKATGVDHVVLGLAPEVTTQPSNPTDPKNPVDPANPPNSEPPPVTPDEDDGNSGGGGGVGGGAFDFDVLDTATTTSYGTAGAVSVNIFGADKRIAPGMSGSYKFTVDNTANRYATLYDVTFAATDTLPDAHKIPMRFRLKADGVYVAGNETTWCTPEELYQDTDVAGGRNVKYTLEWHWQDGPNDNAFAAFGGNPAYSYSLIIKVTAQAE
ncbi:MAG: hypothetical protein ACOX0T_06065 [Pelotomaculum sp.]